MAPPANKRRRGDDDVRRPKKKIRVKKQKAYHSDSEDEDVATGVNRTAPTTKPKPILKPQKAPKAPVQPDEASDIEGLDDLDEAERNAALNIANGKDEDDDDSDAALQDEDGDSDDSPSDTSMSSSQPNTNNKKKRNDPDAFATSISKILDTKLTTSKRADPVLSRSKVAQTNNQELADAKLELAARAQIKAEKRKALQKGRVTDLLGLEAGEGVTGALLEEEKRLKKIAQRGVVRLFNAVRAAQVGAEQAEKVAKDSTVGRKAKEERVSEMSKEGFLQMISKGREGVV